MLALGPEELAREYQKLHASGYRENDPTEVELGLLRQLDPEPAGVYLNWGSGERSRTQERACAQGLRLYGYDPYTSRESPWLVHARKHLGQYDGIISNNVLEHLQRPVGALRNMRQHLKPGAAMLHRTACYEYRFAHSCYHLFFFLGRSVDVMAERAGLRAERSDDPWVIFFHPR
jgi:SAM-dependent methyltransferase